MKPARDPKYLAWIRTLPCLCCGRRPSDPAHTGSDGGTGLKASDHSCVPLCRMCHEFYHGRDGERGRALWHRHGIDIAAAVTRYRREWEAM